ncbi:DUF2793 domain-containing protein [Agrobacterium tumefaciens]|nr:DUF2793 domain-containing protein [Agrobacterium tumefaciens]
MDRINGADTIDIGGGRRGFRDENLVAGAAGTEVTALWLNMLQEEILKVTTEAGLVPSEGDWTQLWQALQILGLAPDARSRRWLAVMSMTLSSAPGAPSAGDAYLIPAGATGIWATHAGAIAQWTGSSWSYLTPPDGHGISLPDGRVFERVGGSYVEKLALDVQSGKWSYSVAGGTANALTALLPVAPIAMLEGMVVRIKIVASNTGPASLNANGWGAVPIKTMRGNDLKRNDLPAGAIVTLIYAGTAWLMDGVAYGDFRPIADANLNFYVSPTGSNSNSGLSAAQPWATLQFAWDTIRDRFDLNGKIATVNLANGVFTSGLIARGQVLGNAGQSSVIFLGDPANLTAVSVTPAAGSAFSAASGAAFAVRGVNMAGKGSNVGNYEGCSILCQSGDISFGDVRFSASDVAHVYAQNGVALAIGPSTIVNAAPAAFFAAGGGTIQLNAQTITHVNTFTYTDYARAAFGSIQAAGATFAGAAQNGRRYSATTSALISTSGGGPNFFPGNVAGVTDTTSSYS